MTELRHPETEYEREDLSAVGILGFLAGLAITGLLIHIILVGMYAYLDTYQKRHQAAVNPLVKTTNEDLRQPTPASANKFPLPRLEVNERSQLYDFRRQEEDKLNTYGWVDQNAGVAHIPVERAMQLIVQRGLPTASQSGPTTTGSNPSQKPAAKQQAQQPGAKAQKE